MKFKRSAALVLCILMALSLFAGCGNTAEPAKTAAPTPTKAPATTAPTAAPASAKPSEAPAESAEPELYLYAVGKYEMNEAGFPTSKYVYEQPFCLDDTTFTCWTTCYVPQYIPEDGWESIPTWKSMVDFTGVHIEYTVADSANRSQNFSVLLASDDLDDLMMQGATFYKAGTLKSAVEDGYFANLYPYKDYMPNYMYELYTRSLSSRDVIGRVFYDSETIVSLTGLQANPTPAMGYFLRQDWLDKMNMGKAADVKTYDQLHDVLVAMKSNFSTDTKEVFPFFINSNVEAYQGATCCGFNTTIYTTSMNYKRIRDNKVEFCGTTEDCRDAMTLLNAWYSEGLISPNFHSYVSGDDFESGAHNDTLGCHLMPPNTWVETERDGLDPDTNWEPMPRTKLTEDQVIHFANPRKDFHYGSVVVSGKCANVALAVTWLDWWISDFGFEWTNWGEEGLIWYYNEQGERRISDFAANHEAGLAWITSIYGCNPLVEFCMLDNYRSYYTDSGARAISAFPVFTVDNYDGAYDFPSSVKLTDEENDESNAIFSDLNTYYAENLILFVDGSAPMSAWDDFQEGLRSFGYERIEEIYQAAYDRFLEESL